MTKQFSMWFSEPPSRVTGGRQNPNSQNDQGSLQAGWFNQGGGFPQGPHNYNYNYNGPCKDNNYIGPRNQLENQNQSHNFYQNNQNQKIHPDINPNNNTHTFVKLELVGSPPIIISPRAETLRASSLTDMEHEVPTADAIPINECKACEDQGEALGQTFWPVQTVQMIGLSTAHMNGKQALVVSVTNDRIQVHLLEAGETKTYLVKSEKLPAVEPSPGLQLP
jgi:hypothetical protein